MDQINAIDHILVEVFGNLSPKMIKTASLVCKRWEEIIGNSPKLMDRYQLNLEREDEIQEAIKLQRKHQTAIIRNVTESLDVISGHNLHSLTIRHSGYTKLSELVKALRKLPSLKFLDAEKARFVDDISESDTRKVQINLEQLLCPVDIIDIFDCNTIKKLKLLWENPVGFDKNLLIEAFWSLQNDLEEFYLFGKCSSDFFTIPEIFEHKLLLKKLHVDCLLEPFMYYEIFIKFLELHKATLLSLEVGFHTDPHFGIELIHKYALENLSNLKHFKLGYFDFIDMDLWGIYGSEISFNELISTPITQNIESLFIRARSTDMNENKRFFAMFPNLKHLIFAGIDDEDFKMLYHIAEINTKLETLELLTFDDESEHSDMVYFPNLKELTFNGIWKEYLNNFINRHSKTLEKVIMNWTFDITESIIKCFLECKNLKYLELHPKNTTNNKIFTDFSLKTKPFTLVIKTNCESKYNFSQDKAVWDDEA